MFEYWQLSGIGLVALSSFLFAWAIAKKSKAAAMAAIVAVLPIAIAAWNFEFSLTPGVYSVSTVSRDGAQVVSNLSIAPEKEGEVCAFNVPREGTVSETVSWATEDGAVSEVRYSVSFVIEPGQFYTKSDKRWELVSFLDAEAEIRRVGRLHLLAFEEAERDEFKGLTDHRDLEQQRRFSDYLCEWLNGRLEEAGEGLLAARGSFFLK